MADGHIVYQGIAFDSPEYFAKMDFKGSKFSNPADIFMKALSINYPKSQADDEKLQLMITSYQTEQLEGIYREMETLKVPPLVFDVNTNPMKPFCV